MKEFKYTAQELAALARAGTDTPITPKFVDGLEEQLQTAGQHRQGKPGPKR